MLEETNVFREKIKKIKKKKERGKKCEREEKNKRSERLCESHANGIFG